MIHLGGTLSRAPDWRKGQVFAKGVSMNDLLGMPQSDKTQNAGVTRFWNRLVQRQSFVDEYFDKDLEMKQSPKFWYSLSHDGSVTNL